MKKTRIALAIAAAATISMPVLATNGDNLIGLGTQSRAMGGTGVAAFMGSENALTNPGLLGKSVGTEFTIGGTLFKPDVKATTNVAGVNASATSGNDTNIIPEVSLSTRLSENLTLGLGIFGSAGMGVDYRDQAALFDGYSNLQLMKFAPTIAYNASNFGIGFSPVIQYGALDINYTDPAGKNTGNGMSTDLGFGFNLGGYFDITKDLTVGLSYQSAIDMEYKRQITGAAKGFNIGQNSPIGESRITSDNLEQPAEIKVGVAYTFNEFTVTGDYKHIGWGSAKGYKDFNWKDQSVFAVGGKYDTGKYWVGLGYNYAEDPIQKLDEGVTGTNLGDGGAKGYANQATNLFNNHFFPGIVEQHFTFGGGYSLTKNLALDAAFVYAPMVTKTIKTGIVSSVLDPGGASTADSGSTHKVEHSQIGYTISLRMNF